MFSFGKSATYATVISHKTKECLEQKKYFSHFQAALHIFKRIFSNAFSSRFIVS